jgi:hypothetical protein
MTSASLGYIALHAAAAGAFGFVLNRYALGTSTELSIGTAVAFAVGATVLAWQQTKRQG